MYTYLGWLLSQNLNEVFTLYDRLTFARMCVLKLQVYEMGRTKESVLAFMKWRDDE